MFLIICEKNHSVDHIEQKPGFIYMHQNFTLPIHNKCEETKSYEQFGFRGGLGQESFILFAITSPELLESTKTNLHILNLLRKSIR